MLTNRNFCAEAEAVINAGLVSHEDNVLAILPLHHTYAFMCTFLVPVFLGATITYPQGMKGPELMAAMDINFNDLVQVALDLVHGRISQSGVSVSVSENLPWVRGDYERLLEVLQNLIDNA